jgi:hypothetical protein
MPTVFRRFVAFCMAIAVVACGSALDVMTTQAEWQLSHLEACYAAELSAIEDYPNPQHSIAELALRTKYGFAFDLYRDYKRAVIAEDEAAARDLFAVFSAVAAGASARCVAPIPEPAESVP